MQPRLKSSTKWTAFPKEYADQIESVFRENFAKQLGEGKLIVEGRIYKEEMTLRIGVHRKGELRQTNFEVSVDYTSKDAMEKINLCVDAAASMMMEYFENDGEMDFPLAWKAFPFEKETVYLQTSSENSELEAAADKLLGEDDGGMIHDQEADADDVGADVEEENDDGSPRMFGGKKDGKKLH